MFDVISITINIGFLGYFIFSLFTNGLQSFGDNYMFIGYLIFTVLTLPNLLSKVIFKSKLFGLTSALLFLYYPAQLLLQYIFSYLTGLSLGEILPFGVIFNLILWNVFFSLFIIGDNKKGNESERLLKQIFLALIPGLLYVLFVFIFIRQRDSVIAIDYLQHLTVPNKIFHNNMLCLLPGNCSNLFLQHGYTTFYHIVFGNLSTFLGTNPIKTFYILDIIYPLIISIPLFMIFKKTTRSNFWSILGVLLSLLTFVMGGYDFIFFIPQTFALYIFILAFKEKKLTFSKLIVTSLLLVSTHFIIGTVLALYLWFRFLVVKNLKSGKEKTIYLILLLSTVIFFVLLNVAGFSIEKMLQVEAVKVVGSLTNAYYPHNINIFLQNLGAGWLLVLIAFISLVLQKRKNEIDIALFTFITFGTVFYFLAPTYANKFVIGIGFFSSIIIVRYIRSLSFKPFVKLFVFATLTLIWSFNFYVQYNRYLTFYTQKDGHTSAIVMEDLAIVEYIKENNLSNTFIISDPYTQIIIAALGNIDTANAQYMRLETRNSLYRYLKFPQTFTYEQLITSPGTPTRKDIFLLYTSRLERTLDLNDNSWTFNMYSLPIDNSYIIGILKNSLINHQRRLNRDPIYISDHFILFK
jgi:hypothetical protein